jgi:hypothetical protein
MQASVWRNNKQKAKLPNVDAIPPSQDRHKVLKTPSKSKKKEVDSPLADGEGLLMGCADVANFKKPKMAPR